MESKEKEEIVKLVTEKKKELDQFLNREWKILEEKQDYKLYYFDEASGLRSIKSEIVIEKSMKEVFDFVRDMSNKPKYDHALEIANDVNVFDSNYAIQYYKYKGKMLFSPRDFYVGCNMQYGEERSEFFATNYVNDKYPVNPKFDRAELIYGGFILKKQDTTKTHVLYYTLTNLHINQTLVNTTLKDVAKQVKYLQELMMKK